MSLSENDVMKKIQECGKSVKTPDRLKPENLDGILSGEYKENRVKEKQEFRQKKRRKMVACLAAAAACTGVVVGIMAFVGRRPGSEIETVAYEDGKNSSYQSYEQLYDVFIRKPEEDRKQSEWKHRFGVFLTDGSASDGAGGLMDKSVNSALPEASEAETGVQSAADMAGTENSGVTTDMSQTNIQVDGVDEGDIVKSDGNYFYIVRTNQSASVKIVKRTEETMTEAGQIHLNFTKVQEMYLSNGKLTVIGSRVDDKNGNAASNMTGIEIYDVSEPENPEKIADYIVSGALETSRYVDHILYVFSYMNMGYYHIEGKDIKQKQTEKYIPCINGTAMDCRDICPPVEKETAGGYLVMTSFNLGNEGKKITEKAVVAAENPLIYVSSGYLYLVEPYQGEETEKSAIIRYAYDNGHFKDRTAGRVAGYLNDRFSMDEYKGYLRVVTTDIEKGNGLYVFDKEMKQVGLVSGLAKDEEIYSARFMGDIGYFVTYRETDPLFSVDLSNPKKPKVLGKLKIPGFSNYLQFYNENLLFGIGEEDGYVKISMFDISDPSDVKETDKKIFYNEDSEAWSDPHSVLIDAKKNIIGFSADRYLDFENGGVDYYVYSYEKGKGFVKKYHQVTEASAENKGGIYYRGLYIGDDLYVVECSSGITKVSLDDFKEKEKLKFEE